MRLVIIALSGIVLGASHAAAIDITTCGQTVPAAQVGVLQAPLVCDTSEAPAVTLEHRATLSMNGHSITVSGWPAAYCTGRACTVDGGDGAPGAITGLGTAGFGISGSLDNRRIKVRNVRIEDVVYACIFNDVAVLIAEDVEVENCGEYGIRFRKAKLTNVAVSGSDYGIMTSKGVTGVGIDTSNNVFWGVSGGGFSSVRARGLTAMNNGTMGVFARRVSLRDSMLSGNGFADVAAIRRPRLRDTICGVSGSSQHFPGSLNWGVCSLD